LVLARDGLCLANRRMSAFAVAIGGKADIGSCYLVVKNFLIDKKRVLKIAYRANGYFDVVVTQGASLSPRLKCQRISRSR
jgi:hypothetical protein